MSREPLTREAIVAALGALLVNGLVVWGLPLNPDQVTWLQTLVSLAVAAWIVWRVRPKVTPVADPRDADGAPLVREGEQ